MKTLYFAYGSNLMKDQMRQRCPGSVPVARAELPGWRWLIGERGFATIAPSAKATVYGALYELTERDEARLDISEGVAAGCYGKFILEVAVRDRAKVKAVNRAKLAASHPVRALVYIDPRVRRGEPSADYLRRCVQGADKWNLPDEAAETMLEYSDTGELPF
jgi:hypothetical protein